MKLSTRLNFSLFGIRMMEAYKLDRMLSAFEDGVPHNTSSDDHEFVWDDARIFEEMQLKGFLKPSGPNTFIITSAGQLHLSKGGYKAQIRQSLLAPVTFWLSIIATVLSIITMLIVLID